MMNKTLLYVIWAGLYMLCAVLGFIPEPEGISKVLMTAAAVLFFLPPALLLWRSWRAKDQKCLKLLCSLSACSLGITLLLMVANLLSVLASTAVGDFLYGALVILAVPMVCSGYWFLGPVLWATLLFTALELLRSLKKEEKP